MATGRHPCALRGEARCLPDFLCSLTVTATSPLAPGPAPDGVNSIESIIPNPPTVGRRTEIARVVSAALDRRPCIITGAPGMGKSEIAVAAAYDPQIVARFGQAACLRQP